MHLLHFGPTHTTDASLETAARACNERQVLKYFAPGEHPLFIAVTPARSLPRRKLTATQVLELELERLRERYQLPKLEEGWPA